MPGAETLAQMYGSEYFKGAFNADLEAEQNKEPMQVVRWLKKLKGGAFVDYGCGTGALLTQAMKLDWRAIGVEFDERVARQVEAHTGARVLNLTDALLDQPLRRSSPG